ncbi:MAG: MG2 domain-containing protein [Verrucomicrobiales bacterium]|nr:MG2 domain-containing protein [Verrucomicrobiales bacterium]
MKTNTQLWNCSLAILLIGILLPISLPAKERLAERIDGAKSLEFTQYPQRFSGRTPLKPNQKLLLRFNAQVDADAVSRSFSFFNKTNIEGQSISIPLKSYRPSLEEIRRYGTYLIQPNTPQDKIPALQNRFVMVEPTKPFQTGQTWMLRSQAGLWDFSDSYVIKKAETFQVGHLSAFAINSITPVNPYDQAMWINVSTNKYQLGAGWDEEKLTQSISISPQPDFFKVDLETYGFNLHGAFEYDKTYEVSIKPGILANDDTSLVRQVDKSIVFSPNRGFIRLPLFSETQNASGHRSFEVEMANLRNIRTRVKAIKGDNLIFALKGYGEAYNGSGGERTIPFSMVPGKTIHDMARERNANVDITEKFSMNWNQIQPESDFGAYYVSVSGDSDTEHGVSFGTHALVQVTDIAMAWKQTDKETLIYAFSIKDGTPKKDLSVRIVSDESEEIAVAKTDTAGVVRFKSDLYKDKELWLDASDDSDRHVIPFSSELEKVGLWSFGIPYRYSGVTTGERRTLIFTDRDVYKPGETVYLKCLSRSIDSDKLLPAEAYPAHLTVTDDRGRKLVDKTVTFSENGSFHDEIKIPELGIGPHSIKIDFNDPESDDEQWNRISYHYFNVAEYRVNTFEVAMAAQDVVGKELVQVPLSAKYYMGKPLSKAIVNWNTYSRNQYPHFEAFSEFRFGDRDIKSDGQSNNNELRLNQNGATDIAIEIPMDPEIPAPRNVSVRAEVTDVNQQTISGSTNFTVHSSDFYIGVRKPEGIHRAGDSVPFVIANIDTKGGVYEAPVSTAIKVEKEIWNTVKVKGSDGKITHRNEKHLDLKHSETVEIKSETDAATSLLRAKSHELKFDEAGDYLITLEATDAQGRKVLTRERFHVIGAEEPAWSWNDVVAIDLIPDRKKYEVGDTAKVLVRSPVFGHALVTTERGDVKDTRIVEINDYETVIDIPITADCAPNVFASVLLVRGSANSPHKHPSADYRLGYCQLDVADPGREMNITLDTGAEQYYIPGQPVEVAALVTDENGAGIPGAEVTIYAVDEGILSLTGYQTPSPVSVFNETFPLSVMMGQSLSDLLPENPLEREFGNKGFVIGGGGMEDQQTGNLSRVRRDFKAVALWKPDLVTDAAGKVTCEFTAPDNLTSFRLMAVVAKGNRFGSSDAPLVINKPLIIEPAIPSFSNLSDQLDLTAVLHNNTNRAQQLEVRVELDDKAVFVNQLGDVIPTSLSNLPEDAKIRIRELTIDPGQTEVLHLPAAMTKVGDATWQWKVQSTTEKRLVDTTVSTIPVRFPLPLLKSSKSLSVQDGKDIENVLSEVDDRLLDGYGKVEIELSNSRMIEATDALEYLLKYPYGCVEQTTSSTLPWLSTNTLQNALPSLKVTDKDVSKAIKKGTTRLLSMQTRDGGLSYWPGERKSILWGSAYGGLALAIASKTDIELPGDRLDDLWKYLSNSLRNTAKITEPYDLSQRCLSVYTLALAGKPEPAYLDLLYGKRDKLPPEARSLLALAIMETNPDAAVPDQRVEILLTEEPTEVESKVNWYRKPYLKATELMAWSQFRPGSEKADAILNELMALRKESRGWGSTYSNAWPLMALAEQSKSESASLAQNEVSLTFGDRTETLKFDAAPKGSIITFPFERDIRNQAIPLTVEQSGKVYANIRVATQPKLMPMQAENHGFGITREYRKVDMEGNLQPVDNLMVGDLVQVKLEVAVPEGQSDYLAIDDPLPSILEAINPDFKTHKTRSAKTEKPAEGELIKYLYTNHRELRKDRTLFFANSIRKEGVYRIQYLTRVISAGDSIAPPAKIEAMYTPEKYGLSATQTLSSRTLDTGQKQQVAAR